MTSRDKVINKNSLEGVIKEATNDNLIGLEGLRNAKKDLNLYF
jgi:hypothetical protein